MDRKFGDDPFGTVLEDNSNSLDRILIGGIERTYRDIRCLTPQELKNCDFPDWKFFTRFPNLEFSMSAVSKMPLEAKIAVSQSLNKISRMNEKNSNGLTELNPHLPIRSIHGILRKFAGEIEDNSIHFSAWPKRICVGEDTNSNSRLYINSISVYLRTTIPHRTFIMQLPVDLPITYMYQHIQDFNIEHLKRYYAEHGDNLIIKMAGLIERDKRQLFNKQVFQIAGEALANESERFQEFIDLHKNLYIKPKPNATVLKNYELLTKGFDDGKLLVNTRYVESKVGRVWRLEFKGMPEIICEQTKSRFTPDRIAYFAEMYSKYSVSKPSDLFFEDMFIIE